MLKFVQKKLKEEKGLTLIELLAVIVILGIIAAIAIPAIGNIIENSRVNTIKADAINIMSAADLYFADGPEGAGNTVSTSQLVEAGYLDEAGSFADSTPEAEVNFISGEPNTFSGTGVSGNVEVTFDEVTRNQINEYDGGSEEGVEQGDI